MRKIDFIRMVGAAIIGLTLMGCDQAWNVRSEHALSETGSGHLHFNAAEMRAIVSVPRAEDGGSGAKFITCIEPSPDIAKVYGTQAGLFGQVEEPQSGVNATLAASLSRASAAAQLGERLATIQVLRDAMYRACEAYANGALSETSYAVMLSRMDDLIVTLLLGEFAAGNFGRELTTLTTSAAGSAGGPAGLVTDAASKQAAAEKEASEAAAELETAQNKLQSLCSEASDEAKEKANGVCDGVEASMENNQQQGEQGDEDAAGDDDDTQDAGGDSQDSETGSDDDAVMADDLKEAKETRDEAGATSEAKKEKAIEARVLTAATAQAVAGGISSQQDEEIARTLAKMARKYVENINFDAFVISCLHALSQQQPSESSRLSKKVSTGEIDVVHSEFKNLGGSGLQAVCQEMFSETGSLTKLFRDASALIKHLKSKPDHAEQMSNVVELLNKMDEQHKKLGSIRISQRFSGLKAP